MALGIRGQLFSGFGAIIALMAGVGIVGWQSTTQLGNSLEDIYQNQLLGAVTLANSEAALWNLRYGFPQFLVSADNRPKVRELEPKLYKTIEENLNKFRSLDLNQEEKELFNKLEVAYKRYVAARPQWFDLVDANKLKEAAEYRAATTTPFGAENVKLFGEMIELQRKVAEQKFNEAQNQQRMLLIILAIVLLIALSASTYLVFKLSTNITKPVLDSVNQIASSSSTIAETVSQQDRTLTQQAVFVNDTTTTIEELGVASRQAAEQADSSATGAKQALAIAEGGLKSVQQTTEGLGKLKDSVQGIAEQIMQLSEQTGQISNVTGLVSDIANQTNMLALNAAVEAARAGEQGKGFAVVASEIRKLADESKKSADRINQLVMDLQAAMNSTVMVTDEGTKTATASIQLAEGTAAAFNEVAAAVNSVFVNSQQIAQNAKRQAVVVQQAVSAMNAINLGAKETASGVVEVKNSTDKLQSVADELKKTSQQIFSAA
jgi:methyl-accepting chemotaxis protein